jgi:hypothetical protein
MRTYNNKLRAGIKSTGQKKLSCRATAFLKYSFLLSAICFIACATYSDQWRNLIRARLMELGAQKKSVTRRRFARVFFIILR